MKRNIHKKLNVDDTRLRERVMSKFLCCITLKRFRTNWKEILNKTAFELNRYCNQCQHTFKCSELAKSLVSNNLQHK